MRYIHPGIAFGNQKTTKKLNSDFIFKYLEYILFTIVLYYNIN
jgi:hypothetical protein